MLCNLRMTSNLIDSHENLQQSSILGQTVTWHNNNNTCAITDSTPTTATNVATSSWLKPITYTMTPSFIITVTYFLGSLRYTVTSYKWQKDCRKEEKHMSVKVWCFIILRTLNSDRPVRCQTKTMFRSLCNSEQKQTWSFISHSSHAADVL